LTPDGLLSLCLRTERWTKDKDAGGDAQPGLQIALVLAHVDLANQRGTVGARIVGLPVLVLHTLGRKTGQPRTNPLCFVRQGKAFVVVGSNGGADEHPGWTMNLKAHKQVWIEVRGKRIEVKARELAGEEAKQLYQRFVKVYAGYANYRRRTKREIPVIALEPVRNGE